MSVARKKKKKGVYTVYIPLASHAGCTALCVDKRADLIARYIRPKLRMKSIIGAKDFWPSFNKTRVKQPSVQPLSKKELNGLENA